MWWKPGTVCNTMVSFILFYFSFLLLCKRGLAIPRGEKKEEEDEKKKLKKSLR